MPGQCPGMERIRNQKPDKERKSMDVYTIEITQLGGGSYTKRGLALSVKEMFLSILSNYYFNTCNLGVVARGPGKTTIVVNDKERYYTDRLGRRQGQCSRQRSC
jgi:hypothetical protein